jgi:hypothetical protein
MNAIPFTRSFLQAFALLAAVNVFVYLALLASTRAINGAASPVSLLRGQRCRPDPWVTDMSQPFNQDNVARSARNLIVVAGHSVTVSGHLQDADHDESDWYLLAYQRHQGLPSAIIGHVRAGIAAAAQDPSALLVFSGGQTRASTGPDSEGSSYYRVADAMHLWTEHQNESSSGATTVRARTTSEDFATDSFQNLLFSICRFYEVTGSYPEHITVVSFSFKQRRFETLHLTALQWPVKRFTFVGYDPPASTGFDVEQSTRGELENAALPFETDPYGCHSDALKQKRRERNPFARTPPYDVSCPQLQTLLHYCGPSIISGSSVPW